ncbi:class I SAM-dependent methyltransferase [Paenibacillus alkalitolerans]|uniref:class I SAM-dependent methyltransferase n=1 Tax=Paenibacillus alkalitolerans TaxID=2799335 RepID=UPI0018F27FF1|nr:class I SAM-dependent methyltransferase [Paenibacillus alkalitolerans]
MEQYYWDGKIDYLSNTRGLYYNDDYIEFLVRTVWKIERPVRIIDFGCGYGFLGLKLLPFLPQGSTYTGIDAGVQLIERARKVYKDLPYEAEFIAADIWDANIERKYDMAVCHAFLLHISDPIEMLKKMLNCVTDRGKIACFEPHWISAMANQHLHEIRQSQIIQLGLLQKLFEDDALRTGKDGNIGMKLPIYLTKLGVKNVECRVSDKVNFLNPYSKTNLFESLREDGVGAHPGEREPFIRNLVDRGVSEEEARQQYENELLFSITFDNDSWFTCASNMKITFGTVMRG